MSAQEINALASIIKARTQSFTELVALTPLDPAKDFRGADFTGVDLRNVDLSAFDLTGADLSGATWDERTRFNQTASLIRAENSGSGVRLVVVRMNFGKISELKFGNADIATTAFMQTYNAILTHILGSPALLKRVHRGHRFITIELVDVGELVDGQSAHRMASGILVHLLDFLLNENPYGATEFSREISRVAANRHLMVRFYELSRVLLGFTPLSLEIENAGKVIVDGNSSARQPLAVAAQSRPNLSGAVKVIATTGSWEVTYKGHNYLAHMVITADHKTILALHPSRIIPGKDYFLRGEISLAQLGLSEIPAEWMFLVGIFRMTAPIRPVKSKGQQASASKMRQRYAREEKT